MATTDQQYYEDPKLWGEAQYMTLKDIIDNMMLTYNNDSYFKHAQRHEFSIHGKRGIKKLKIDIKQENRAIMIQLPPTLIWAYPRFMTNWMRVSVVDKCGNLHPLQVNSTPTIADYLQDNNHELFFDDDGFVLQGANRNYDVGYCCLPIECEEIGVTCPDDTFKDSWVKSNNAEGYFEFSEELEDENIVIEFQSAGLDGLQDSEVLIHHNLEMTITRWIEWQLLMGMKNINNITKDNYHSQYKIEKNRSRVLMGGKLTLQQIVKSVGLRYQN